MIFSEANIYILSKLVALLRRETGHRFRLNSQAAINQLINEAARHSDERIQTFYLRFLDNLTDDQRNMLRDSGVNIISETASDSVSEALKTEKPDLEQATKVKATR